MNWFWFRIEAEPDRHKLSSDSSDQSDRIADPIHRRSFRGMILKRHKLDFATNIWLFLCSQYLRLHTPYLSEWCWGADLRDIVLFRNGCSFTIPLLTTETGSSLVGKVDRIGVSQRQLCNSYANKVTKTLYIGCWSGCSTRLLYRS